jgi:hypothetical protein
MMKKDFKTDKLAKVGNEFKLTIEHEQTLTLEHVDKRIQEHTDELAYWNAVKTEMTKDA